MWAVTILADRSMSTQPATWIVYPLTVFVMSKSYRVADAAGASERVIRAATTNAPAIPSAMRDMDEPRRRDGGWGQEGSANSISCERQEPWSMEFHDTFLRRGTCSGRAMEPVLQVALDFMHAKRALQAAEEGGEGGADWIEAGTQMIKSEGAEILRQLRKMFPGRTIVADLKRMDTGAFEIEIAAKAGADVITVMGVTDDATIEEAVKAARRYGAKIMVDLMRVEDEPKRANKLEKLGVYYLNLHVSIDEQMIARTPLDELKTVARAVSIPVAVAGGLNSETVAQALEAGASIVIVGGAIIKAEKVREAARTIKKAMKEGTRIPSGLYKKYGASEVRDAFLKVSTPNLADAMQKRGALRGIEPHIRRGSKMVGPALTVKTANGDWAKPVEAIDRANPGDVIVIDAGGGATAGWGELASH